MSTRSFKMLVKAMQGEVDEKMTSEQALYLSEEAKGFQSILRRSLHLSNSRCKEVLMDIATWTGHNSLGSFVDSLKDLETIFDSPSPQVIDYLENCFQTTADCQKVENVEWSSGVEAFVFYLETSKINEAKTKDAIKEIML